MADDMNKQARAAGYKDAAEMQAFLANRRRMRERGGSAPGTKGTMGSQTEEEKRLQMGKKKKPSGGGLWDRISSAVSGATGN